ncbi:MULTISPECIES: siderophore-interacting protein [unclassified Corynebacterium]|uniref:siderophore-interacting protein n=1 Tax=unclassified Corynebacterium TaxID=2624378 RepID=UPI003523375E
MSMSLKNIIYRTTLKALSAVMGRTMAMPTNRNIREELVRATVTSNTELAPQLRRITLRAAGFKGISSAGPDEYVALIMPPEGKRLTMPDASILNPRAAIAEMNEDVRPNMRYYTIRELHPEDGEMVIDIVTHGASGPGSAWALNSVAGDEVGVRFLSATYRENVLPQLLIADATAVPALSAIVESLDEDGRTRTHVIVIAESDDLLAPGLEDILSGVGSYTRLTTPLAEAPTAGVAAISGLPVAVGELSYAWICGEQSIATSLRRHLTKDLGMDRRSIFFSGYWRLGKERS